MKKSDGNCEKKQTELVKGNEKVLPQRKKTCIRIACFLLAIALFCLLEISLEYVRGVIALKTSSLYPYINKVETDTFLDKINNPESYYQTINGNIYFLERGNLYKTSIGGNRMCRVISYDLPSIRSFFVTEESIFYCTEIGTEAKELGNTLRRCNLDGSNEEILYKNVDACTMLDENTLLLSGHLEWWTLGTYDLKNKQFKEIKIYGTVDPEKICFHDNLAICAYTYNIRTVDIESGEVEELWSLYDDYEALAEITSLYVYDDKIYYGVKATRKKANSVTGLWRMDFDGKNQEQLTKEEVFEICFVGGECIVY